MQEEIIWVLAIAVILLAIIYLIYLAYTKNTRQESENKVKQDNSEKAEKLIAVCKNIHTFAELKETFSVECFTYLDLFDLNFNLKDVQDDMKVIITLYFSKEVTKEKLLLKLENPYKTLKLGSVNLI